MRRWARSETLASLDEELVSARISLAMLEEKQVSEEEIIAARVAVSSLTAKINDRSREETGSGNRYIRPR